MVEGTTGVEEEGVISDSHSVTTRVTINALTTRSLAMLKQIVG